MSAPLLLTFNPGSSTVKIGLFKVAADGAVIVVVSRGDTHASGSGRLAANAGNGSWKTSSCAGLWTAERRS